MGIITISRTHGSGGTTFARELAKELGYSYIDRTLINDECLESDRHTCSFGIDEGTAPGLHGTTQELMADSNFYKVCFIANILDHALRDNAVMTGMGAGIILAWLRLASGSVWAAVLFHGFWNYFVQQFYPLLTTTTEAGQAMLGEFGWFCAVFYVALALVFWHFRDRLPTLPADRV